MKISHYIQLLVMICLIAGLAVFFVLKLKFDSFDQTNHKMQLLQHSQNDIAMSQTMSRQWFTTIDRYYADRQSHLIKGISSQTEQINDRLTRLEQTNIDKTLIIELKQRITSEVQSIEQSAFMQNSQLNIDSKQISASKFNTRQISTLLQLVNQQLSKQFQLAKQDNQMKHQALQQQALWLLICYVIIVIGAAYWISNTLIKPLEALTEQTSKNISVYQLDDIHMNKGPHEVQRLASSFHTLYQRITTEMDEALKSQTAEQRAKDRLKALVNNVSLSIITIDTSGVINSFNPATVDLFAIPADELDNRQISELLPNLNIHGGLFKQMLNAGVDIELDAIVGNAVKPVELSCAEFTYSSDQQHIHQYTIILHDISHRKRNEDRVRQLNQRLINTSRQAGIAEIATSILHSVGNVLNSVNTSIAMIQQGVDKGKIEGLRKAADMFNEQGQTLFAQNGKAPQLIEYLYAVIEQLEDSKTNNLKEVASLKHNVNHIAEIVSAQQKFSGKSGVVEPLDIAELLEEALNINVVSLENNQVAIERHYNKPLEIMGDRSKIIQILVNLIRNANEAMMAPQKSPATITLSAEIVTANIIIKVEDNGHGISDENMDNMFRYGFTTKADGHGFGLHSCALAAKEMHGSLTVHSQGNGYGALFCLTLPNDPVNRDPLATIIANPVSSTTEHNHG